MRRRIGDGRGSWLVKLHHGLTSIGVGLTCRSAIGWRAGATLAVFRCRRAGAGEAWSPLALHARRLLSVDFPAVALGSQAIGECVQPKGNQRRGNGKPPTVLFPLKDIDKWR